MAVNRNKVRNHTADFKASSVIISCVLVLFAVAITLISRTMLYNVQVASLGNLMIRATDNKILLTVNHLSSNGIDSRNLSADIGVMLPTAYWINVSHSIDNLLIHWSEKTTLNINKYKACYIVKWETEQKVLKDCLLLDTNHLYGGAEMYTQYWSTERTEFNETAYVTNDILQSYGIGGVVEPYWLLSNGFSISVTRNIPLFVSLKRRRLCLNSQYRKPYALKSDSLLALKYNICMGNDIKDVHVKNMKRNFMFPERVPDNQMFRYPIWSTWVQYGADVCEDQFLQFASTILTEKFNASQVELDDNWESCYGDAKFNNERHKFENAKMVFGLLRSDGLRSTLWIHPFINNNCSSYKDAMERGYLVKSYNNHVGHTKWWRGENAGIIDFTNSEAVNWWTNRLKKLNEEYFIDSFKFDAGEASWLPENYSLDSRSGFEPNVYSMKFVEAVSSFGNMIEVRVGHGTQSFGLFVRMQDKLSTWGYDNGLKALIPTLLLFNILGYPFVLPDMIGGNGYNSVKPTKELFIRWLQACVFMPALQFSYVPWEFDSETTEIAKKYTSLHYAYSEKMIHLANLAVTTGYPINRPLWGIDPMDEIAWAIDTEYLLGNDILVCPILYEGTTARDIYIPAGIWRDEMKPSHDIIEGPVWLWNYSVQLSELAYFTLLS